MLNLKDKRFQDNENFLFLQRLLKNPRALGAIAPSSKALARFICRHIDYNEGDYVIEVGAGTGRFTRAILQAGIPESQLIVLELDKELARYLKTNFPGVHVIQGNATELETLIPQVAIGNVCTVISGIPMVNLPKKVQKEIIDSCFQVLGDGGGLLQFTYGLVSPIPAKSFGIFARKLGRVLQNIPPATIWHYSLTPLADVHLIKTKKNYMRRLLLKLKKPLRFQRRKKKV
ncbi:class I SAM-dependent methyltransferase [Candidatus Paracaedibacter symbiosus]|uniref:class I SAM-dependent methyltransferase n=1 Tax=Candidatus Paracaedibacter symbiosus TaxID=244582 RepID=UPI000691150C|nr:methyltransferase domain-containing protein [Candidatus Paracaedibacter symbiosus]